MNSIKLCLIHGCRIFSLFSSFNFFPQTMLENRHLRPYISFNTLADICPLALKPQKVEQSSEPVSTLNHLWYLHSLSTVSQVIKVLWLSFDVIVNILDSFTRCMVFTNSSWLLLVFNNFKLCKVKWHQCFTIYGE